MPHRFIIRRLRRWFIYRVIHVDDTPHRIALGIAIGIFICWTPSMPFQMILTVALSTLLRANKFVGLPFVWISNPLTIFPVYWPSYKLGRWITGSDTSGFGGLAKAFSFSASFVERVQAWWTAVWQIFWELWVGSLVIGTILAVITYFAMYRVIALYRRFRRRPAKAEAEPKGRPRSEKEASK